MTKPLWILRSPSTCNLRRLYRTSHRAFGPTWLALAKRLPVQDLTQDDIDKFLQIATAYNLLDGTRYVLGHVYKSKALEVKNALPGAMYYAAQLGRVEILDALMRFFYGPVLQLKRTHRKWRLRACYILSCLLANSIRCEQAASVRYLLDKWHVCVTAFDEWALKEARCLRNKEIYHRCRVECMRRRHASPPYASAEAPELDCTRSVTAQSRSYYAGVRPPKRPMSQLVHVVSAYSF